jgi:hypothetical protein
LKAIDIRTACRLRGLLAVVCLAAAAPAFGQRVQFPTMVDDPGATTQLTPVAPNSSMLSNPTPAFSASPVTSAPLTAPPASPAPALAPPTWDPYAAPLAQAPPAYGTPAPYSPYSPSPYAPPPTMTPQPLYPEGIAAPQIAPPGTFNFPSVQQGLRFMQEVRVRDSYLFGSNGSNSLMVDDLETSATFAIPFYGNAPLLITPGYGMHFWGGPITTPGVPNDLPARTYEGYLDGAWHPQITPWLSANLGVRGGAYTDFDTFTTHSIRIMGRGLGIITLTPTVQIAVGIVYIDRVQVKLLPAGGIIWIPNPDARYEILFPNPKLSRRWRTLGNTEVWYYGSGEYGGGSWTIKHADGSSDQFDYNDIRVNVGVESFGHRGLHGFFETGFVFDRKLIYRFGGPNLNPSDTVMLRAGLSY